MWEPQHLTTLWAFTDCYRDFFIFFTLFYDAVCRLRISKNILLRRISGFKRDKGIDEWRNFSRRGGSKFVRVVR
jgi:hypothetical protein